MEDYRCWNKYGEVGLNEAEIRDSYMERGVPTSVEEDILGFTDCDDDKYSNGELAKYKKMIEDSKKLFYHGCAAQYMRLFVMVKLFQLKTSNRWSDCSFKDLLTLLKDMLPQGIAVPKTIYEVKQIIYQLGLEVKKVYACKNDCILYRGAEYENIEKCPICGLDQFNRRRGSGDDENCNKNRRKGGTKNMFWYFPIIPHLKRWFANKKESELL
jgi:hypothetical protein